MKISSLVHSNDFPEFFWEYNEELKIFSYGSISTLVWNDLQATSKLLRLRLAPNTVAKENKSIFQDATVFACKRWRLTSRSAITVQTTVPIRLPSHSSFLSPLCTELVVSSWPSSQPFLSSCDRIVNAFYLLNMANILLWCILLELYCNLFLQIWYCTVVVAIVRKFEQRIN